MRRTFTFGLKIGAGFAVSCLLALVVGFIGYRSTENLVFTRLNVTHGYAVLQRLSDLISTMKDAETGARGYALTGKETYLEPYLPVENTVRDTIRHLRELTVNDPNQQRRLDVAAALVHAQLNFCKRVIDVRRAQGLNAAVAVIDSNDGKTSMDKLRQLVVEADAEERRQLDELTSTADASARNSERIILFSSLFSFLLVSLIGWFITSSLTRQIGAAAVHVQSSSAELQAAANQQADSSSERATAMNEVVTTIVELLSTSRQIAENAQRVSEVARETLVTANKGGDTVLRSTLSIEGIKQQVDIVVSHVLELGKKSQQIGGITEIINELAEQTNILAINASIEAAGAGESGKRFAVVADEIRKLADRVAVSAAEIRQLLGNIQTSANSTAVATENYSKAVEAGVREFVEVAASFKQITVLISTASEAAREIELSTRQQTSAVEQVKTGASDVVQAAHENETSSRQMLQTSSELAGLSRELAQMIQSNGHQLQNGERPE
jgi:methyl-accepting chemotaxis protein